MLSMQTPRLVKIKNSCRLKTDNESSTQLYEFCAAIAYILNTVHKKHLEVVVFTFYYQFVVNSVQVTQYPILVHLLIKDIGSSG